MFPAVFLAPVEQSTSQAIDRSTIDNQPIDRPPPLPQFAGVFYDRVPNEGVRTDSAILQSNGKLLLIIGNRRDVSAPMAERSCFGPAVGPNEFRNA